MTPTPDEDDYFTDDVVSPESDPVDLWERIKKLSAENKELETQATADRIQINEVADEVKRIADALNEAKDDLTTERFCAVPVVFWFQYNQSVDRLNGIVGIQE